MTDVIKIKRSYLSGAAPLLGDLEANEVAINYADKILYVRTPSNTIQDITLGGSGGGGTASVNYAYATTADLPATGDAALLYCTTDNGRLWRWTGSVYAEVGPVGGGGGSGAGVDEELRGFFLPPAPAGLTATAGNAQVSLTWTAPTVLAQTPITDYAVQFSSNGGTSWTTFSDGTSTTASATVTGLTNGTAYVFRVAAVNGVGQGAWSTASSSATPGDVFRAIPTMTSNTAPSGVVSGPSNIDDSILWRFFDGNEGTIAFLGRGPSNIPVRAFQYAFPEGQKSRISGYTFTPMDGYLGRCPLQWKFYGSDDTSTWTLIETRASVTWSNTNARTFTLASAVNYRAYKWEFGYDDAENDPITFQTVQLVE